VVWDVELSAAAAVVLASVLEWPRQDVRDAQAQTLRLVSAYYRLKAATDGTQTAKGRRRKSSTASLDGRRSSGRLRLDPAKAEPSQIKLIDKDIDRPDRIVLAQIVI
jgi:DNA helicase-2/ATP-dependent DNA helicase PcrA